MADVPFEFDRDLTALEADLKRLEAEYNMFFAGRLPRPPWETRARVTERIKRLDQMTPTGNYGQKFRFSSIQSRFATFVDLWDRGLRAREEGRPGPLSHGRGARNDRTLHVATLSDPARDEDTMRELYQRVVDARRELGQESIPYQRFSELIKTQVNVFKEKGSSEVAFRVSMRDGKVAFTARALKRAADDGSK